MPGFKDTIMNVFAPTPEQAPVAPAAPANAGGDLQQAAPNVDQAANTAPNGVVPEQITPAEATPNSPLDEFKELWQNTPKDSENTPNQPVPLSADAVQKAVAKTNFSQAINAETMAAITAGGEGATEAFANAMNQVAQQVMVQATMVGSKLTEKTVADAMAAQAASLPELVRSQQVTSHLADTNPLFNDPAVKPVIEATQARLQLKYPTATPAQITEMTQNFITTMGEAFAPQAVVNGGDEAGTDWDAYMNT